MRRRSRFLDDGIQPGDMEQPKRESIDALVLGLVDMDGGETPQGVEDDDRCGPHSAVNDDVISNGDAPPSEAQDLRSEDDLEGPDAAELPGPQAGRIELNSKRNALLLKQPRRASSGKALVEEDLAPTAVFVIRQTTSLIDDWLHRGSALVDVDLNIYSIDIERARVKEGSLESSSGLVFTFD